MTSRTREHASLGNGRSLERPELTDLLRERTHDLHARAERSGIVNDVLRGRATRFGYAMLLRNLLPAYRAMEQGLERIRSQQGIGAAARHELYRAPAIEADLQALFGEQWDRDLALLPEAEHYARRVTGAAAGEGGRLIAHAYTRYLGDLSGGQIMKRLLASRLKLVPSELAFHDFPKISDPESFKQEYRRALNDAAVGIGDMDDLVGEAMAAFEHNIAVSEAVQRASGATADS